ncbi:MAG: hypothetical protein Q9196_006892, partial [Gyalolechia fulgens]
YDCLSTGLLPNEASNFQSAEVLLGLTPSLLTMLAPSIGEISLVSTRRRMLALLLAVANPSIYVSRLLSFNDPREYVRRTDNAFPDSMLNLDGRNAAIVAFLQYALAAGAIVNVVHLSWELGFSTVIAWKCNASYIPFLWTMMPLSVHVIAAAGWHLSTPVKMVNRRYAANAQQSLKPWCKIQQMCVQEMRLPSQHPPLEFSASGVMHDSRGYSKLGIFLNELAGFGAFLHLLFGTTVFSSLMFISVLDALRVIARYIASGLICRLIVKWELAAMRAVEQSEGQDESADILLAVAGNSGVHKTKTFP